MPRPDPAVKLLPKKNTFATHGSFRWLAMCRPQKAGWYGSQDMSSSEALGAVGGEEGLWGDREGVPVSLQRTEASSVVGVLPQLLVGEGRLVVGRRRGAGPRSC